MSNAIKTSAVHRAWQALKRTPAALIDWQAQPAHRLGRLAPHAVRHDKDGLRALCQAASSIDATQTQVRKDSMLAWLIEDYMTRWQKSGKEPPGFGGLAQEVEFMLALGARAETLDNTSNFDALVLMISQDAGVLSEPAWQALATAIELLVAAGACPLGGRCEPSSDSIVPLVYVISHGLENGFGDAGQIEAIERLLRCHTPRNQARLARSAYGDAAYLPNWAQVVAWLAAWQLNHGHRQAVLDGIESIESDILGGDHIRHHSLLIIAKALRAQLARHALAGAALDAAAQGARQADAPSSSVL